MWLLFGFTFCSCNWNVLSGSKVQMLDWCCGTRQAKRSLMPSRKLITEVRSQCPLPRLTWVLLPYRFFPPSLLYFPPLSPSLPHPPSPPLSSPTLSSPPLSSSTLSSLSISSPSPLPSSPLPTHRSSCLCRCILNSGQRFILSSWKLEEKGLHVCLYIQRARPCVLQHFNMARNSVLCFPLFHTDDDWTFSLNFTVCTRGPPHIVCLTVRLVCSSLNWSARVHLITRLIEGLLWSLPSSFVHILHSQNGVCMPNRVAFRLPPSLGHL